MWLRYSADGGFPSTQSLASRSFVDLTAFRPKGDVSASTSIWPPPPPGMDLAGLQMFSRPTHFLYLHFMSLRRLGRDRLDAQVVRQLPGVQRRLLSCSSTFRSGHNRWSKIRHDKGKNDKLKSQDRGTLSYRVFLESKCMILPATRSFASDLS